jgi:hypothetical protein
MGMKNTEATLTRTTEDEMRDTIRQALIDWNNATDEQRAEALRIAAEGADKASRFCRNCGSANHTFCNR